MYRRYKIGPWKGPWIKDDTNKASVSEQDNDRPDASPVYKVRNRVLSSQV